MWSQFYNSVAAKIFSTACSIIIGLVSLRLFAKYLEPGEFGILVVASQVLTYISFLDGGVRTVVNRSLLASSDESVRGRLLRFCEKFYVFYAILVMLVIPCAMLLYYLTPNVRASGEPLLLFIALGFSTAFLVITSVQGQLLIGLNAQHVYYWNLGVANLVNLAVLAGAFAAGLKLWSFIAGNLAMGLYSAVVQVFFIRRRNPQFRFFNFEIDADFWSQLRTIWRDAFATFRCELAIFFLYTAEVVIVGVTASPQAAAAYALLVRILSIIRNFIQSLGEVSWPFIATFQEKGKFWSGRLLHLNAWIYGSVTGGVALTLTTFLRWYMGPQWLGSNFLLTLLLTRFVIAGLQSPAGYYLLGAGRFSTLAKWVQLELGAAILFSAMLARYGAEGVAGGFLAATVAGTLYPIPMEYARDCGVSIGRVLTSVWLRFASVFVLSALITTGFTALFGNYRLAPIAGAAGALMALAFVISVLYLKIRSTRGESGPFNVRDILKAV